MGGQDSKNVSYQVFRYPGGDASDLPQKVILADTAVTTLSDLQVSHWSYTVSPTVRAIGASGYENPSQQSQR